MADDILPSPDEQADTRLAKKRAYNRAYRAANAERLRAKARAYYAENTATRLAWQRDYYWNHREERRRYARGWRVQYRETNRARDRRWRQENAAHLSQKKLAWKRANRETINARKRERYVTEPHHRAQKRQYHLEHAAHRKLMHARWRAQNRVHVNAKVRERHLQKLSAFPCDLTVSQWREIMAACDYQCVYCEQLFPPDILTQDHLTPIIKGGAHTVQNILPACPSCNSRKQARDVLRPVQPFLLTIAPPRKTVQKLVLQAQTARNGQEG